MVCINFIKIDPTSTYLDINVFTSKDFDIVKMWIKADGGQYVDKSNKLICPVPNKYAKEQIIRIPLSEITPSGKHLFFVKFDTVDVSNDTHGCKPAAYKEDTTTEVAIADTRFVYNAKLKMIKQDISNPNCITAQINAICKLGFIEDMFNDSVKYEQFIRASYWMNQLENEVNYINANY